MKKVSTILLTIALSLCVLVLAACGGVTVKSITISKNPTKTTYAVGETIDLSGGKISAVVADADGNESTIELEMSATGVTVEADLSAAGDVTVTIKYGGQSATFTVNVSAEAAHTHTLEHVAAKAATEEAEGNIEYWHCASCGKYFSDAEATTEITLAQTVIAKLAHTHTLEHVAAKAATEEAEGNIEYWHCTACGKYFSDSAATTEITLAQTVIAKLAHTHTLEHVAAKAATEDVDGNIEYWHCTACDKYFSDAEATTEITLAQTVIEKLVHTHTLEHVAAVAATCEKAGNIEYWHCTACGKYFSDAEATTEITLAQTVAAKLDHEYGEDGICKNGCGLANYNVITLTKGEVVDGKFTVTVAIGGVSVKTSGFTIRVNYSELGKPTISTKLSNTTKNDNTTGVVVFTFTNSENLEEAGNIAVLTFDQPLVAGTYTVSISVTQIVDSNGTSPNIVVDDTHYGLGESIVIVVE